MPFFDEGHDPLSPQPGTPYAPGPLVGPAPDPFATADPTAVTGAAFRQNNPIVSVLNEITNYSPDGQLDPNHNPLDIIKGTKYEANNLDTFLNSPNEATTRAIMARIDKEESDRQTLAASGVAGTVASVGAGLLDPTLYIPVAGEAN